MSSQKDRWNNYLVADTARLNGIIKRSKNVSALSLLVFLYASNHVFETEMKDFNLETSIYFLSVFIGIIGMVHSGSSYYQAKSDLSNHEKSQR